MQMSKGLRIEAGYRAGLIGRCVEMHARFYARTAGFGLHFESKVATELSEFARRLDNPLNGIWAAVDDGSVIGTVAIDGEDLGSGLAHLRWFIVDEERRGSGTGRHLLREALSFSDRCGFRETHLWTFKGLEAAGKLYRSAGFDLLEEQPGRQWGEEVIEQRYRRHIRGRDGG